MTTNNTPFPTAAQPPAAPIAADTAPAKEPRIYSKKERWLVLVAIALGVLVDRLLIAPFSMDNFHLPFFSSILWLAFTVTLHALYYKQLLATKAQRYVAGCVVLLCVWSFFFDYNSVYGILLYLVIPAVLMAQVQCLGRGRSLKEAGAMAIDYVTGWFIKPFSAIPMLFGAASATTGANKKAAVRRTLLGVLIALLVLCLIIPLLMGADQVFGHFVNGILRDFDIASFIGHAIVVCVAAMLFYSFLWNTGVAAQPSAASAKERLRFDALVSGIVLGAVLLTYVLFCAIQFTYLFAGAGLPAGMTYSEYAREGFAQITLICALNLLLFGLFLHYGKPHRSLTVMLAALLAMTGVMIVSGMMRLGLYVNIYGMTWLRLLSGWFLIFLAAVVVLCGVRMIWGKLPLIATGAFVLLGWYIVLGYVSPDAFIVRYNLAQRPDANEWVRGNVPYVLSLSDDALLTLLDAPISEDLKQTLVRQSNEITGYSLSSHLLRQRLAQTGE